MATLEEQYEQFLAENPNSELTFEEWENEKFEDLEESEDDDDWEDWEDIDDTFDDSNED